MAVSAQDSQNWIATGAQDAMARTYAAVKAAIEQSQALKARNIEVFLQGSYANNTNIRGDSDVDIVIMLRSSWNADTSRLSRVEKVAYDSDHSPAAYTAEHLRQDVIKALQDYFGANRVKPGNKAIRVNKSDSYVDADVVPAIQHRAYVAYDSVTKGRFVEGTRLYPQKGASIVNFPKVHKRNGSEKNSATKENFKPAVRQVKQLKRRAAASGRVDPDKAPGYLIECMVFNAPDNVFVDEHHGRLFNVLKWLLTADLSSFTAVDTIHELFRTDPGNFSETDAKQVINGLVDEAVTRS
ncbi:MAG TPA: nucleotidyltransferase [Candidatus Saccharimonadales bacterium]|nr:nucleotidyltransferase [Candidatus Saccharimonadales bacterium]